MLNSMLRGGSASLRRGAFRSALASSSSPSLRSGGSFARSFAGAAADADGAASATDHALTITRTRNIGISAHIDSGKTTLTERILFYTGRIHAIHDVRGKDGVGAKMDSMDLEREKGITIQSAATYTQWETTAAVAGGSDGSAKVSNHINIIDTPGHVDFTIEVERALRVLDGGVLVLCGVSGVQSQSLTVDRQMKRYRVPRLAFINKLDRTGSDPDAVIQQLKDRLGLNAAAVQLPIGLEELHEGVVCLVRMVSLRCTGPKGEVVEEGPVPEHLAAEAAAARETLIEKLADVDEEIGDCLLMEEEPTAAQLGGAIRRATLALEFVPVFMGSAFKNKGVQPLLDGVVSYLPSPTDVENRALDTSSGGETEVVLPCAADGPLVALAFKLEETRFGQLTYLRLYSGELKRGDTVFNQTSGKKLRVPRLVRMHSDDMEEVESAAAGDVVAMFGADCASMDTFTDAGATLAMTSMFVPEPVMSLAISAPSAHSSNFSKALGKFRREDPTFQVSMDAETKETVVAGMGELHLEIYIERMLREYEVPVTSGAPRVNYRETVRQHASFSYLHKKQSGGSGQYAKVMGFIEPLTDPEPGETFRFESHLVGNNIPPEYVTACEKGANEAMLKGPLTGNPLQGVRCVLEDGAAHAVDSSELAFKVAMQAAVRQAFMDGGSRSAVLEPVMKVTVEAPSDFQGSVIGGLNKRKALILANEQRGEAFEVTAEVPLEDMFGYSTDLRSSTQGMGEFTMEFTEHRPVTGDKQVELVKAYERERTGRTVEDEKKEEAKKGKKGKR